MEDFDFTEEEIRDQLDKLGYHDVPQSRLQEFKRDLEALVKQERSKNSSISTFTDDTHSQDETVPPRYQNYRIPSRDPYEYKDYTTRQQYELSAKTYDHPRYDKENLTEKRLDSKEPQPPPIFIPTGDVIKESAAFRKEKTSYHPGAGDFSLYSADEDREKEKERLTELLQDKEGLPDTSSATEQDTSTDKRFIKRKVLRKRDGHSIIDESVTESEADDLEFLRERLRDLPLRDNNYRISSARGPPKRHEHFYSRPMSARSEVSFARGPPKKHEHFYSRPMSARSEPLYHLPEDYQGPKALIRPMTCQPHTRDIRKTDPVRQFQKYNKSWKSQKAPGEKNHKNLRWNIREQMSYHDKVVEKKNKKVHVPNSYVVPTDKKRKDLRWQIRMDMAQGVVPPSVFD